jgi:hypothetical protein
MLPLAEGFSYRCPALRTSLASPIRTNSPKIHSTLPTYPLKQRQKCSQRSIDALFPQHPSVESNRVEVFSQNGLRLVAKIVGSLKVEVFTSIPNMVMQSGYFDLCFLPVLRTFILSSGSALQQFQLALQSFQKFRTFDCSPVTSSQEFFKSQVNPYSPSMYGSIGNRDIRRNGDDHIPLSISTPRDNPHLFDPKPVWDWAMQVDCHQSNLGQLDLIPSDGIALELWKYKGPKLPILFESRKPKPAFLKRLPSIVQSTNRSLQHLRMQCSQIGVFLLSFGQLVLLSLIARKRSVGTDTALSRCVRYISRGERRSPLDYRCTSFVSKLL